MKKLTFIDFYVGIGGGRLAFEKLGLKCLGFYEIDKNVEKIYRLFHGETEKNYGDLTKINTDELPDFDVMVGVFPCQTFSVIVQRKGMEDKRGEIIFHLINIMKKKNVKFFLLENVKGLVNHGNGRSLNIGYFHLCTICIIPFITFTISYCIFLKSHIINSFILIYFKGICYFGGCCIGHTF